MNEVEGRGLGRRNEVFEAGDLARAVGLLDESYLEGVLLFDMRDGRTTTTEQFAPEQVAEALARFEELEAGAAPTHGG